MNMRLEFTESLIQGLFGHEAAEDEDPKRLKEYYFKGTSYEQVNAEQAVRLLVGHKGIGKSALFKVAMAENEEQNNLSILVQPNDIGDLRIRPLAKVVTRVLWGLDKSDR
jgi:hypothetical protein